jgi:GntR family transcriptional repressor for pyruvate dehydrogenase complex
VTPCDRRFAPLRREKLSETVAQQLREQIRDGGLESGERIPGHRELADAFSVGLSSVREAISMLVSEGLIETRAGRGTFVRHRTDAMAIAAAGEVLTRREVEEVIEARELLELQLVAMAAERGAPEHIKRLKDCLAQMEASVDDGAGYAEADVQLHLGIAEAAGNRFLRQALEQLRLMMRANMEISFAEAQRRPDTLQQSLESHRKLIEAIEAADTELARSTLFEIMSRHHELVLEADRRAPGG